MKERVTSELHSTGSHVLCMLKYYYAVVVYNAVGYRKDVDPPSKMARTPVLCSKSIVRLPC
jgi:hypothetical protein